MDLNQLDQYSEITDISFDDPEAHLAICHKSQGGSANGWHTSLITKVDQVIITEDIIKSMKELGVDIENEDIQKALTANTKSALLSSLVKEKFKSCDPDDDSWWCVCDYDDAQVVFSCEFGCFAVGYTEDDAGAITIGNTANPVILGSTYVEVPSIAPLVAGVVPLSEQTRVGLIAQIDEDNDLQMSTIDINKAGKTASVGGTQHPKSDFAYTPSDMPSEWKLPIFDARHTAAAVAALGKGFRGKKASISSKDLPAVKKKVAAAYRKFFPKNDVPDILKSMKIEIQHIDSIIEDNPELYSVQKINKDEGVTTVDLTELMKSAEFQDILKAQVEAATAEKDEALKKATASLDLLKAERKERIETGYINLFKSMEFITEEERVDLVKGLLVTEDVPVVVNLISALEKANDAMLAIKKSMTTEVGMDGEVITNDDITKSRKELDEMIASRYANKKFLD